MYTSAALQVYSNDDHYQAIDKTRLIKGRGIVDLIYTIKKWPACIGVLIRGWGVTHF